MIQLTSAQDGTTIYVAPENITFITKSSMIFGKIETTITASDGMLYVTESPEEVARKVLEYRLAMDDYLQGTAMVRNLAKENLFELAGLEE